MVLEFIGSSFWLVLIVIGLLLTLLEILVGVETGYDLVIIGSAFILGGLISWPFNSWVVAAVFTSVVCIAYLALGRRYVHKWTLVETERTNVDAMIGKRGVVVKSIGENSYGLVRVGSEDWRARPDRPINEGAEVLVAGITGVTLTVRKREE